MQVPDWLVRFVTDSIGMRHAGRRAQHTLSLLYNDIQKYYPNKQLTSELAWRRHITGNLFSQWCKHILTEYKNDFWVYKIVRLLARITTTTPYGVPSRGRQKDRLRLCQNAEMLYDTVIHHLQQKNYCLNNTHIICIRKFIASYPVWYTHQLKNITTNCLVKWVSSRMPDNNPRHIMISTVVDLLAAYDNPVSFSTVSKTSCRTKLCDSLQFMDKYIPTHIRVFFAHFFKEPCRKFVSAFDQYLDTRQIMGVYRYQIWAVLKTLLFDMSETCHQPLTCTLQKINDQSLKSWLNRVVIASGQSVARRYRNCIKHILQSNVLGKDVANASSICTSNIILDADARMTATSRPQTYSDGEIKRLQAACVSRMDCLLLNLFVQTGLRSSAVRNLKVCNFTGSCGTALEKGRKWHTFPISPSLQQFRDEYFKNEHDTASVWVFPDTRDSDHCMTSSQIRSWLQKISKRAHVMGPHVTLHSFRRYVVTTLLLHGNDMHQVMKYIGHTHPSTTVGYWCTQPESLIKLMKIPWYDAVDTKAVHTAAYVLNKYARQLLAIQQQA